MAASLLQRWDTGNTDRIDRLRERRSGSCALVPRLHSIVQSEPFYSILDYLTRPIALPWPFTLHRQLLYSANYFTACCYPSEFGSHAESISYGREGSLIFVRPFALLRANALLPLIITPSSETSPNHHDRIQWAVKAMS